MNRNALRLISLNLSEAQLRQYSPLDAGASLPRSAPTTPREMTMLAIWPDVLGISRSSTDVGYSCFKKRSVLDKSDARVLCRI